jgi:hypothetical protein
MLFGGPMFMIRKLDEDEIRAIFLAQCDYEYHIDPVEFAKALLKAARVQQTCDRDNNANKE